MKRIVRTLALCAAAAVLVPLVAGCAAASVSPEPARTADAGFAGYKWTVVAIAHDGTTTAIPARYSVFLMFTPSGQFIANEPVNTHAGTYRVTSDGFVTSDVAMTLVGYGGHDPIVLLAENAIGSFNTVTRATASVAGNRLTVVVGDYTLTCQRDGKAANIPQAPASPSADANG